jgi:hypothetical protein
VEDSKLLKSLCDGMRDDSAAKTVRQQTKQTEQRLKKQKEQSTRKHMLSTLKSHTSIVTSS